MTVQMRTREDTERAATVFQDRLINLAVASASEGRNSLIEAPTGSGKSRMYTRFAKKLGEKGLRVFVAAHRKNLVTQGADNYDRWNGHQDGETTIGMNGEIDQRGQTVFSTIQTASSERTLPTLQKYDVLIIDEAHHATEDHEQYNALLSKMMKDNPALLVIGVTATPPEARKGLHATLETADHHVATFEEVVEAGLVVIPETIRPQIILKDERSTVADIVERHRADPRSAEMEGGITKEMRDLVPANWIETCADMYDRHLHDRRTLGFQERITEAEELREELCGRGYDVVSIHSRSHNPEKVLRDFRHGRYDALMSVDMISEGYDVPACEGVLLTKFQTSEKELRQIYGRGSRGLGGEERTRLPRLVDMGASTLMHGDLGSIAKLQSLRGDIERDVVPTSELLPGKSTRSFSPWVPLSPIQPNAPQLYGTSIDGRLIYAAETSKGFVAVTTEHHQKKGDKVQLFEVPGARRKGVIEPERFGDWIRDRIPTNERALAQMTSRTGKSVSKLESLLQEDFGRNGASITHMVKMMSMPPIPREQMHARAGWSR